jgi:protein-tyrosine phosphatase
VSDAPVRVLMVCTGNICRSPMMERIFRSAADVRGGGTQVEVVSAGTCARSGEPMQPFAAAALSERSVSTAGFEATPVTAGLVASADLVLTATRGHRAHVVGLAPGAVRRTFTLLELARISTSAPPAPRQDVGAAGAQVRLAIAWAAQMRGSVPRPTEDEDDLTDPLGAPLEVYRARAEAISAAVEQVVPLLLGLQDAGQPG